ncbi:MAG TPA: glycosyltransferase family 39 protein [Candidatus Omnitrophota bacterium]|nr:glycosyltransferase family 39 protein [Candidatus Omnitrophota bacterium]HQO59134.1 glycosyltransferase family 39 protein [Candidatus Omnitrophota bacterium]
MKKSFTVSLLAKVILILFLLIVAGIFRLHNLALYDLTFDELGTGMYTFQAVDKVARLSGQSHFTVLSEQMKNDPHSPLYYFIIYFFSKYGGEDECLRLLSVILSLSTCLLFFCFSTLFLNFRGSVLAMGLLAIHPLHIWYAQEARMYASVGFFVLLMATVFVWALRTDKIRLWILFLVTGMIALMASYFTVFLLIAMGLVVLLPDNRLHLRKWTFLVMGMVVILLLLRPIFFSQFHFVKHSFWIPQPSFVTLFFTQMIFNQGFSAACSHYFSGLVLFSSLFVLGVLSLFSLDRQKTFILSIFIAVPFFLSYFISKYYVPIYIHRQLMIFSPFYYLGIAQGIERILPRRFGPLVFLLVAALLLSSLRNYYDGYMFPHPFRADLLGGVYPKKRYQELFHSLNQAAFKNDSLIAGDLQSYILLRAHLEREEGRGNLSPDRLWFVFAPQYVFQYDQRYMGIDAWMKQLPPAQLKNFYAYQLLPDRAITMHPVQLKTMTLGRLWVVTSSWDMDRSLGMDAEELLIQLRQLSHRQSSSCKDGICVDLFAP